MYIRAENRYSSSRTHQHYSEISELEDWGKELEQRVKTMKEQELGVPSVVSRRFLSSRYHMD